MFARKNTLPICAPVPPMKQSGLFRHDLSALEQAMEYIGDDELVEITPTSIRMRNKILDRSDRERAMKRSRDAKE